jgi:hypothetical protein
MVPDIGEHQASACLVHDDADVAIDPDRPEVRVLRFVDPVELETRAVGFGLEVKGRQLHLLLLVAGQPPSAFVKLSARIVGIGYVFALGLTCPRTSNLRNISASVSGADLVGGRDLLGGESVRSDFRMPGDTFSGFPACPVCLGT